MTQDFNAPSDVEVAVGRALRDNLARIQGTSEELHHAVADVVSACSSNKPTNALPPLLRAQAAAASLGAALEVLSRFVTIALTPGQRSPYEAQITSLLGNVGPAVVTPRKDVAPTPPARAAAPVYRKPAIEEPAESVVEDAAQEPLEPLEVPVVTGGDADEFAISRLSAEEQELHRRANRVAKVSMQDIRMLNPEKVRLGRENKDLCIRLKDDIDKAHREYDRRFKPIMDHPVDYFYRWMVEILAEGDAHALGEYPYATPARQPH